MMGAAGRANELLEFIVEPFVAKVILLLRDPFLQPEVRFDLEFCHDVRSRVESCETASKVGGHRECRALEPHVSARSFRSRPSPAPPPACRSRTAPPAPPGRRTPSAGSRPKRKLRRAAQSSSGNGSERSVPSARSGGGWHPNRPSYGRAP